ncbi:MAG TPA: hypothetical protein VLR27_09015 [Acidimicrobiales bacterium]|nr:hypothetical protein [Acidimicrobiales bacterium]
MGAIADKRLGDFLPTIDAYRPVAIAVAAILGLVVVVPGAVRDSGGPIADFSSTPAADGEDLAAPATDGGDGTPDRAPSSSSAAPAPTPTARPAVGAQPVRATSPAPRADAASPSGGGARAGSPPAAIVPDADGGPAGVGSESLRIAAAGWASSTGGTPVGATVESIPEGALPVGTRVGQTDKVAFVRLAGDATALVLAEDAAGRRGSAFDASPVQLCQVTAAGWEAGEDQAMSDAPPHDPDLCAPGQQGADGTWSFTLTLFEDPTDDRGLALVPTADAPLDFQITFAGQALG